MPTQIAALLPALPSRRIASSSGGSVPRVRIARRSFEIGALHAAFLTAAQDNRVPCRPSPATPTSPATTAARPRCATCSASTGSRSARRWPSGWAPAPASTTSPSRTPRRAAGSTAARRGSRRTSTQLTGAALELRTFEEGDGGGLGGGPRRRRRGPARAPPHRPLLPRPLRQLGPLPGPRRGPRRLRRRGRPASPTPASRSCRRPGSRTSTAPATAATPPTRSPATCSPRRPRGSTASGCGRRSRRRSSVAATAMLEPEFREFSGLDAVRRFAEEAGSWPEVAEDWRWCARFGYQVIERRGTGGGAFRLMYSRFLEEAGRPEAPLAADGGGPLDRARRRLPRRQRERRPRAAPLAGGRRRRRRRASRPSSASGPRSARASAGREGGRGRHDPARRAPPRARAGRRRRCGCGRRIPAAGRPGSSDSTG